MMKTNKKLRIHRETLRALSDSSLRGAHGGYYTGPAPTVRCTDPYWDKNCSGWTLDCATTGC